MKTMKGSQRTHELQNVELLTYEIISLKCCILYLSKLRIRSYEITCSMMRCLMSDVPCLMKFYQNCKCNIPRSLCILYCLAGN